jgi:hypothetical protein
MSGRMNRGRNPVLEPGFASVNDKVSKRTGKPFKSGRKVNTVKELTVNPNTGQPAFTFLEDDSIVDQRTCKPATEAELALNYRHWVREDA